MPPQRVPGTGVDLISGQAQGQQRKTQKTSSQRRKEQNKGLQDLVEDLRAERRDMVRQQNEFNTSLIGALQALAQNQGNGNAQQAPNQPPANPLDDWGSMSEEKLVEIINNPEVAQEKPHLITKAAMHLADRQAKRYVNEAESRWQNTQQKRDESLAAWNQVQNDVISRYGTDIGNAETDLGQMFASRLRSFQERYGKTFHLERPELVYRAADLAAEDLGIPPSYVDPGASGKESETTESATEVSAPAPEDMPLSGSEGAIPDTPGRPEPLQGDTKGYSRSVADEIFGDAIARYGRGR